MAENIGLVAPMDLPVSEYDAVEVVVIENKELKRKPVDGLGGGEKTDLVLNFTSPLLAGFFTADNTSVTIESGSLDAIVEALRSGRPPVVKVKHFYFNSEEPPFIEGGVYDCSVVLYNTVICFTFVVPKIGEVSVSMDIEDTGFLQVLVYPFAKTTLQVI